MRKTINLINHFAMLEHDEEFGSYVIVENAELIDEKAPPGKKAKRFIKKLTPQFKKRYGDAWKQVLYATAWKNFG